MADNSDNNSKSNHGYVYILSNPSMPGLLKIGMTRFDPTRRVQELSSATGVPTQFQLIYYREFHNCVAAELEIHSILAAKGMRYNDQREFFSVDSVEAINTLLLLDDEEEQEELDTMEEVVVQNANENIDWDEDFDLKTANREKFESTELYKKGEEFIKNVIFDKHSDATEDISTFKYYVDNGFYIYVPSLACRLSGDDVDKEISIILDYAEKGYVSGYIDVISIYLDDIDGINNLTAEKKQWVASMLNKFDLNYRNASVYDFYIQTKIDFYCGISHLLGFQYDKSFLKALSLDDEWVFYETWIWGVYNSDIEKSKQLCEELRKEKDLYSGTSAQLQYELLNDDLYKKFHSSEGDCDYYVGVRYAYGLRGVEKDESIASDSFSKAISEGCKKAYLPLSMLFYSDKERYFQILYNGVSDSCPQCIMEIVDRLLLNIGSEEEIDRTTRSRINRFLDLFLSQVDLAFWVDAESCLDAIKKYVLVSVAFQRRINKEKLALVVSKIRAIADMDLDTYYSYNDSEVYCVSCFFDSEIIVQEAVVVMTDIFAIS